MQHASAQTFWPRPALQPLPQLRFKHKFPLTINLKEITLKWKWPGAKFTRKAKQRKVTGGVAGERMLAGRLGSWAAQLLLEQHHQHHQQHQHGPWPDSDSDSDSDPSPTMSLALSTKFRLPTVSLELPNSCPLTSYPASTATTFGCTVFQQFGKQMRAHNQMNAQINKTAS